MVILVKLLGIITVVFGVTFLMRPEVIKKYMAFWTKGKRVYTGGSLSILIGIILLFAASQCGVVWFVTVIGIWGLIKGIILFILGPKKVISMINWWIARPPAVLRILALLTLSIGTLLVCSA